MDSKVYRQAGRTIWRVRFYQKGKRVDISARTTDYNDARKLLKELEGEVAKGVPVSKTSGAANAYTFDEAARAIVNDYRDKGRSSLANVKRHLRLHLRPAFGALRMDDITGTMIGQYRSDRRKAGAERATINREMATLRRMFKLGLVAKRIHYAPHIETPNEDNARVGFVESRDDFDALAQRLPTWMRDAVTFAYFTGWRLQAEVVTLEWWQVDTQGHVVRLTPKQAKNKSGRVFPYDVLPELAAVIDARLKVRDTLRAQGIISPYVFCLDDAAPLFTESIAGSEADLDDDDEDQVRVHLIKACRDAFAAARTASGMPGRLLHDFRRTAVRNLVRAGVPEKQAMELTGHKTRAVFDRYDIVNEADLRVAVGKLASASATSTRTPPQSTAVRTPRRRAMSTSSRV